MQFAVTLWIYHNFENWSIRHYSLVGVGVVEAILVLSQDGPVIISLNSAHYLALVVNINNVAF